MAFMHRGAERMAVTIRYPHESERHGTSLKYQRTGLTVTRCKTMQLETNLGAAAIVCCGVPQMEQPDTVGEQLLDFLDGRTNGEELLHALYDHVLDERVPERMRALFSTGSAD